MTASITPSTDGKYVDVFVPIAFKKFGGRKTIVARMGPSSCRAAARRPTAP